MKRAYLWALLAAGLVLTGVLPLEAHDPSELLPARVLTVRREDGWVHTACDSGAEGVGKTLDAALADMARSAEGVLFLDTAEHILLHGGARELTAQVAASSRLRPAARLYLTGDRMPDAKRCAAFLQAHPGRVTLGAVHAAMLGAGGVALPRVVETEGRLRLLER